MDHLADAPIANVLILAGVIFLAVGLFGRVGGFIGSIFGNIEAGKNARVLAGVLGGFLILGGAWLHQLGEKATAKNSPTVAPPSIASTGPASPTPTVPAATVTPAAPAPSHSTHLPSPKPAPVAPAVEKNVPPTAPAVVVTPAAPAASHNTDLPSPKPAPITPAAETNNLPTTPASEFDDRLEGTWNNLTPRSDGIKKIEVSRSEQGLNAHPWYSCPSGACEVGSFPVKMTHGVPMYDYASPGRHRKTYLNLFGARILLVSVDISDPDRSFRHNWVFVKSTMPDKTLSFFARYFREVSPKALAHASNGSFFFSRGSSTEDASQTALRNCVKGGGPDCKIILVNDDPAP